MPTETQDSTTAVLRGTAAKFVEMNTGNLHFNGVMLMTEVKIKDKKQQHSQSVKNPGYFKPLAKKGQEEELTNNST